MFELSISNDYLREVISYYIMFTSALFGLFAGCQLQEHIRYHALYWLTTSFLPPQRVAVLVVSCVGN